MQEYTIIIKENKSENLLIMNLFQITFILVILSAASCGKKDDCVYKIKIQNNSSDTIIYSRKLTLGVDPTKCQLTIKARLSPDQSTEESLTNNCWEDKLKYTPFEFYIVNKDSINEGGFYDCDSINYYNDILRYYRFDEADIDSLKSVDWIIRYP